MGYAVVTGASGGIGEQMSTVLAAHGRDMREAGGGRILNMASCAALCGGPYMSGYYSSKA